jgi:hypothetical protein
VDLVLFDDNVAAPDVRLCPHGHEMTPENTRVRYIRTSFYAHRECWTCIRERRRTTRAAYRLRVKQRGVRLKVASRISPSERAALQARHDRRIAEVGYDWARKRKSKMRRVAVYRAEREKLTKISLVREEAEMLMIARQNPELGALIAEQARDARTFQVLRSDRFVPQDWADRLLYGESSAEFVAR